MTAHDDVLDLVRRWAAAEQQNDAGLLDGLLASDFVGVGPLGFVLSCQATSQLSCQATSQLSRQAIQELSVLRS